MEINWDVLITDVLHDMVNILWNGVDIGGTDLEWPHSTEDRHFFGDCIKEWFLKPTRKVWIRPLPNASRQDERTEEVLEGDGDDGIVQARFHEKVVQVLPGRLDGRATRGFIRTVDGVRGIVRR